MSRALIWFGGIALLSAALLDGLAVIGRQTGLPIHGVIELVQAAILIGGSVALVVATRAGAHARVHLLLERMPDELKRATEAASNLLSALFFVALLAGGIWLAMDMWGGHEMSELLGVPYAVLRAISNAALAAIAVLFLWDGLRSAKS